MGRSAVLWERKPAGAQTGRPGAARAGAGFGLAARPHRPPYLHASSLGAAVIARSRACSLTISPTSIRLSERLAHGGTNL
jgi:hypothetical protein